MKRLFKKLPLVLAVILLVAAVPMGGLAAIPDYLDISSKSGFTSALTNAPALSDGQVWVDRSASSDVVSPTATVTLSALGQSFQAPTVKVKSNNVVFVLDYSSSMQQNSKAANMAAAANSAVEALNINNNQLAVVQFYSSAVLKRGLSTVPFTLTTTGSDDLANNMINVYPPTGNGTNIQAGLNAAYNELLRAKNDKSDANPVIILLTDGAPTYYYPNIQDLRTSGTYSGSGSSTTNNELSFTAIQAAYLKTLMPELRIYTIGFDTSGSASALAALYPTDTNIAAVYNLRSAMGSVVTNYVPSAVQGKIVYNYTNGYYTASNSTASLNAALNQIIRGMNNFTPVTEINKTGSTSELADTSYVYVYDTVGNYFTLGSAMTLTLNGSSYTFTYHSDKNAYTYDTAVTDPSYNASLANMKVLYDSTTRKVTWMIPASVLPCRDSGGGGSAVPIRLSYTVTLEGTNLQESTYNTSTSCSVNFTPAADNPYYSTYTQQSSQTYTSSAEYYSATFPSGSSGATTLWSFASGSASGSLTYASPASAVKSASYSTSSKVLSLTLADNSAEQLSTVTSQTASTQFATNNLTDATQYVISSFTAGGTSYSDAKVTSVVKSGSNYNITVVNNSGNSTVQFTNVAMTAQAGTLSAVFSVRQRKNSTSWSSGSEALESLILNGTDVTDSASLTSYTVNTDNTISFVVFYNGVSYQFNNVLLNISDGNRYYHNGTAATAVYQPDYQNKSTLVSTSYYLATGSDVVKQFSYTYDSSINKITLTIGTSGTLTFRETVTATSNTQIVSMAGGGFIVKVTDKDPTTGVTTVTTYTLTAGPDAANNTLTKTISIATPSGPVSNTMTSSGSMTLTSNSIINNVTLRAGDGSGTAFANTLGQATVVLTFTSKAAFNNMAFSLSTAPDSLVGFTSYTVTGVGGGLQKAADGKFYASTAGTYTVTLQVTNPNSALSSFMLYMYKVDYKTNAGTAKTLPHFDGYANQKVKVVFNSPMGH